MRYDSQYYDTIRTGYINAGFSPDLLEQSVIANMKKEDI